MPLYAIGDLQGCHYAFQRLLKKIDFRPDRDQLWLLGDLVNRGGQSLELLRQVAAMTDNVCCVLGNHDLSYLAERIKPKKKRKPNSELEQILAAKDGHDLLDWLQHQKLFHYDRDVGYAMVHAGLHPQWSLKKAEKLAAKIEKALRGRKSSKFLTGMYGNEPNPWCEDDTGIEQLRSLTNVFTRIRFCTRNGHLDFEAKGKPGSQPANLFPWYQTPGMKKRKHPLIFAHWSALGLLRGPNYYALDTGCVWGGQLTAMRLDQNTARFIHIDC